MLYRAFNSVLPIGKAYFIPATYPQSFVTKKDPHGCGSFTSVRECG